MPLPIFSITFCVVDVSTSWLMIEPKGGVCMAAVGQNVEMVVQKDGVLVIKVDLSKEFGLSGSGKSVIIGSTGGNVSVPGYDGSVKVGLNVYRPQGR
jgi:hypothetical protein